MIVNREFPNPECCSASELRGRTNLFRYLLPGRFAIASRMDLLRKRIRELERNVVRQLNSFGICLSCKTRMRSEKDLKVQPSRG
jgi:hypothetical protein